MIDPMMTVLLTVAAWALWQGFRLAKRRLQTHRARRQVSVSWLTANAAEATKQGWEGPRWRTPAERARMDRTDRRKALSVVSRGERRAK